jgi:hypothetical protein
MAGRAKAPLTAGRRELKTQMDRLLKAAVALDRIDPAAGERLRRAGASALAVTVSQSIQTSDSDSNRSHAAGPY